MPASVESRARINSITAEIFFHDENVHALLYLLVAHTLDISFYFLPFLMCAVYLAKSIL